MATSFFSLSLAIAHFPAPPNGAKCHNFHRSFFFVYPVLSSISRIVERRRALNVGLLNFTIDERASTCSFSAHSFCLRLSCECRNDNFMSIILVLCRKTCQACKCPRETHSIYQEQVTSVRERLGLKPATQTSKVDARQLGYTWTPPGIVTSAKVSRAFANVCVRIPLEK